MPLAPKNTAQAEAFLQQQRNSGTRKWKSMCLSLQRQARGLPVVYPSALSAARATPTSERIHKPKDLRRGMVAYWDHPSDSNPYGHIAFVLGRNKAGVLLTMTNLADGRVGIVPFDFYEKNWGDPFQFGATWLNGYDFNDFNSQPKRPRVSPNFDDAIEVVNREIHRARQKGWTGLVKALQNDKRALQQTKKKFPR